MPLTRTAPAVACSRSAMTRSSVVLPQPDGPISEMNSPSGMLQADLVECDDAVLSGEITDTSRTSTHRPGRRQPPQVSSSPAPADAASTQPDGVRQPLASAHACRAATPRGGAKPERPARHHARAGLFGCVVQLAYSPVTIARCADRPHPAAARSIVMQPSTGQTDDAQVAADAFVVDHLEVPLAVAVVAVIAWCEVSSQTMWQRPHWMHRSWSMRAFSTYSG